MQDRPDRLAQFRHFLEEGAANIAATPNLGGGGFQNTPGGGGFGGFGGGGNFGGGGGMDPWQTSVENRLGSLEARLGGIDAKLGKACEDISTLNERVSHLPTKGWLVTALITALVAIAGLIGFAEKIQALLGQDEPPAITAPTRGASPAG